MMRSRLGWVGVLGSLLWLAGGGAADAGVVTGVIDSVSSEQRTISVKIAKKEKSQVFSLPGNVIITVDGKSAPLNALEAGDTVAVTTTGSNEVTRLTVKTGTAKPAATKPVTAKPEKKTAEKKTSKKPGRKPLLDDEGNPIPSDDAPMEDDAERPELAAKSKSTGSSSKTGVGSTKKKAGDKHDPQPKEIVIGEWPQFRGPNRDNISREPGLLAKWPEDGPQLAWKQTGIGLGYSSVSVAQGRVFTMGNLGEEEFLFALDAKTGDILWSLKTGQAYHNGTGDGPRGTPTIDDDRVYALGGNGDLVCAGVENGDQIWHLNILKEFNGDNITWGICESVLIDGDRLICTPGGKRGTFAALNKHTGKTVWTSQVPGNPSASYASMIAVDVGKVRQYVNFVHTAVVGVKASDGKPLWGDQKSANGTANCSTPIFYDDAIFSASGYGTGGALVKLASAGGSTKSNLVYHTGKMKNHHGGMAAVSGYLYGFDEGTLVCLELKSGKVKWEDRSVGKGSLTIADGMLYLRSEEGPLGLAEVTPDAYNETGRFNQPNRSDKPAWAHPAVAGGKLYLRDMDTLLVYDVKAD